MVRDSWIGTEVSLKGGLAPTRQQCDLLITAMLANDMNKSSCAKMTMQNSDFYFFIHGRIIGIAAATGLSDPPLQIHADS